MKRGNMEKEIRESWFKEHIAKFEKLSDRISVLEWCKPRSSFYYCRYVLDGSRLYITGDIGDAVFRFTEIISLEKFSEYSIDYFYRKLTSFEDDKCSFDSNIAIARMKEEIKYIKENMDYDTDYDEDDNEIEVLADTSGNKERNKYINILKELMEESESCFNKKSWDYEINQRYDVLSDYDSDIAEWIYSAGDAIPHRVYGYLIGLKMAYDQLKKQEIVS